MYRGGDERLDWSVIALLIYPLIPTDKTKGAATPFVFAARKNSGLCSFNHEGEGDNLPLTLMHLYGDTPPRLFFLALKFAVLLDSFAGYGYTPRYGFKFRGEGVHWNWLGTRGNFPNEVRRLGLFGADTLRYHVLRNIVFVFDYPPRYCSAFINSSIYSAGGRLGKLALFNIAEGSINVCDSIFYFNSDHGDKNGAYFDSIRKVISTIF